MDEKVPDSKVSVISISDLNRALAMQNKAPIDRKSVVAGVYSAFLIGKEHDCLHKKRMIDLPAACTQLLQQAITIHIVGRFGKLF